MRTKQRIYRVAMPMVSVVIAAYNQAQYLAGAIQSVLDQTCQDFEIVIVDDGSTDNTSEVAHSFCDPRLRYIHQANRGLSAARNTGIANSTAPLVSLLDSDDLFLPEKLALLTQALERWPEVGVAVGQVIRIDRLGHTLDETHGPVLPQNDQSFLLGNPFHPGAILARRWWLEKAGPFDESLRACEDWDMWLRLSRAGCHFTVVDQPVVLYRIHGQQMTQAAERMRTAVLAVLKKTFEVPDLPASWQRMKDQAYSAAYVRCAAREYRVGAVEQAKRDLAGAVAADPSLVEGECAEVAHELEAWAFDPATANAAEFMKRVYGNLPDSLSALRKRKREALARIYVRSAFEQLKAGRLDEASRSTLQAVRYQPKWLANRGLLSILVRSVVSDVRLMKPAAGRHVR